MGGFPDGVSFLGKYVRENGWFSGRSIFFGGVRSGKGVVFRTEYLFWGSTFGKRGNFPDGVPLLGATVRKKGWFSGRSASFGSNRSGKGVVFWMECLFWEQPFGKRGDFPDGGFTAVRLPQRLCGWKGRCPEGIRGAFRQVPIRSAGCLPQIGASNLVNLCISSCTSMYA